MAFSYIDIFAGAGGLSEGFQRNGYIPVAHVEMKKEACLTLKTRECFYYLKKHGRIEDYKNYLRREITRDELYAMVPETVLNSVINETMSEEGMPALFDRIDQLMEMQGIENIDVLVGGPPCQAYSLVGRARSKTNMVGDPRNYLYMLYCEVLEKYRPKIFVFENVPGLLTANGGSYFDDMRERFRKAGYFLEHRILNSKEYGVLQNRRRVIVIGWREGTDFTYPELDKKEQKYLVDDLFSDLPYIEPGESRNIYKCKSTEYLRKSGIRTEDDILTLHQARPNLERDRKIYRQVIEAWNNGQKRLKYTELPEELCTHNNRTAFLDRFKVVAKDR